MSDPGVLVEPLKSLPLLRGLPDDDIAKLAEIFEPVDAKSGDALFDRGDQAEVIYLLTAGQLTLEGTDETYELAAPVLVGELGAIAGLTRNSRAVVGDGAALWRASASRLAELFEGKQDLGLAFEKNLLDICGEKIDRDQRRLEDMRSNLIRTQKAMKKMRDLILESADTAISGPLHDIIDGLIQHNRRVNYRVSPPSALPANLRVTDEPQPVVEISRTHLSYRATGDTPDPDARVTGVLSMGGPEIPISGRVLRTIGSRVDVELDLLLDEYSAALEGYLTRLQMLDFLV